MLDEKSSAVSKLEQDIVKLKNAVKDESSISGKLKADLDAALEASQQLQARHSESQAQLKLKVSVFNSVMILCTTFFKTNRHFQVL